VTEGDCFTECGTRYDNYWDVNNDHELECGNCEGISAKDLLGFDDDCSCGEKIQDPD
jgi:hypothetical protein